MSWEWRSGSWLKLNSWHRPCFCGVQEFTLCKHYYAFHNCLRLLIHVVCSQSSCARFLCMFPITFSVVYVKGVNKVIPSSNYQAIKSYRRCGSKIPCIYLNYMQKNCKSWGDSLQVNRSLYIVWWWNVISADNGTFYRNWLHFLILHFCQQWHLSYVSWFCCCDNFQAVLCVCACAWKSCAF
jgi:hypothetical protein